MKILLDTCVWSGARDLLSAEGHDVIWAGSWESDPGDVAILEFARVEGRILVTLDKDFGELAVLKGHRHCGVIRLVDWRAAEMGRICSTTIVKYSKELAAGALVTVSPRSVRIRSPILFSPDSLRD
jgi:predicted nuclease of predicted toxin-antitoxin system